jgi:PAS domain S-box-containing protein
MEQPFDILLVDDDIVDRMTVRRALQSAGVSAQLVEAEDAQTALDELRARPFDCVLLDYRLPQSDGLAVLKEARRAGVTSPVVMLTGQGDEATAVGIMKAGATDYIAKAALSPERLAQSIRQAVRIGRAERAATEAQQEAQAQRFRLQSLFMEAPVAIAVFEGAEHRCVLANPIIRTLLQNRDLVGRSIRETAPELEGQGLFDVLDHVYSTGETYVHTEQPVSFAGTKGVIEERFFDTTWQATRDATGQISGVMSIGVEVTDQVLSRQRVQHAEERLRLAVEVADVGIWDFNPDTELLTWDNRCRAFFGLPADAPISYPIWLSRICEDDRTHAKAAMQRALSSVDDSDYAVEYRTVELPDGPARWVAAQGKAFFDHAGRPIRVLGTIIDVTERKRAEAERERLYAEAQRAIRSRDDLLATVSHDLRSPLGTVMMVTVLLQRHAGDGDPARIVKHAGAIKRAADTMERLIRDLLDMAAIEAGHLSTDFALHDAAKLITDAVEHSQPVAQAKALTLRGTWSGSPNIQVRCDRDRIGQVFSNLIGNATKFTPQDGVISVTGRQVEDRVAFTITDTGSGIDPVDLPRVFERFWQAKEQAKAGTGLGLAICQGIVQHHGGLLTVESTLGRGTTFSFSLPIT